MFSPEKFSDMLKLRLSPFNQLVDIQPLADDMLVTFRLVALEILNHYAPFKERTIRRNLVPWFNETLRQKFKQRDCLYTRARR